MNGKICFAIASICALAASTSSAAEPARRPNILLILSDDHSAPHLGCYGDAEIRTPNIDRLAGQGMRLDRAYVACPQCVPSRSAIMSGRSPVGIQMTRFSAPLPAEVKVFPELLRAQGYYAGVAGRTFHLDGPPANNSSPELNRVMEKNGLRTFPRRLDYVKVGGQGEQALGQFREFLGKVPDGKPFVLQLCFSDPHRPLDKDAIPHPHDPSTLTLPPHYPDTRLVREDFARYYDEIARFDGYVGRVLEELEKRGLAQDTLVAVMGDNGASQFRGKGTLYEFGVHVPLVVRWPGRVAPGTSSADLISGEDLAPTFLEAAGEPIPAEMTGRSFLKLLKGEPYEGRTYVFSERGAHGQGLPTNSANFDLARCVIGKRYKLIYTATWQIPYHPVDFAGDAMWKELKSQNEAGTLPAKFARLYFTPTRPMFELYDLRDDPNEFDNLAGKKEAASIEAGLKAALMEWMVQERDYLPLPLPR